MQGASMSFIFLADMEVPFESSSTVSLLETEALPTETIFHLKDSYRESENINLNSTVPTTSFSGHRMNRTEEWVQHLDKTQGENDSSTVNDKHEDQRDRNDDETVQDVVDDIIHEAVNENTPTTSINGPPVSLSTSRVYIMPHGKESQPLCLNARSSFSTCSNNNFSNSIVTPLEKQGEHFGAVTQTYLGNVSSHTAQLGSQENIGIDIPEGLPLVISQSVILDDVENLSEEPDAESNYDPSDWEHSAPSSAIDDQDIISRYAELEDEGLDDDDNFITDILRILPLAFVR